MMLLILLILTNGCLSQVTGCMTRWYTAISDNIGSPNGMVASQVIRNPDCFGQIPRYKEFVTGHLTNMECYIYEKYIVKPIADYNSSRCGQCLEITGPTQKPFVCMIAGTFKTKPIHNLTESDLERIVFVSDDNYNYIATIVHAAINHATQVTVRAISCPYQNKPSLAIIGDDTLREGLMKVQVINSNTIHKYLVHNNVQYPMNNEDGTYSIPKFESDSVKLVSYNDRQVTFKQVNSTKVSSLFLAETQYTELDRSNKCEYVPQNQAFGTEVAQMDPSPVNRYYTWTPIIQFQNGTIHKYNVFGTEKLVLEDNLNKVTFAFSYPSVMRMTDIFSELIMKFNFNKNESLNFDSFALFIEDYNNKLGITQSSICTLTETRVNWELNSFELRISLNKRECDGFANGIKMELTTGPESNLEFVESNFIYKEYYSQLNQCGFETLYCNKMECTPPGKYKKGCEPNCGFCSAGYECSSEGECLQKQKKNTRNSDELMMVVLISLILVCLI